MLRKTKVFLDNASTTAIDPMVLKRVVDVMKHNYGNPSSIHQFGRESRVIIEEARKTIADKLNIKPFEIIFTSGGTESINSAIYNSIFNLKIKDIITSRIEHPAVLNTINDFSEAGRVKIKFVRLAERGHIDLENLEKLLQTTDRALVILMHANNEIGNLLSVQEVGLLCRKYNAVFLCDTVQTIGKYNLNLSSLNIDFASCSAHKFHGPKGVGFLYINRDADFKPLVNGGGQERGLRSGTENISAIAGLAEALKIAYNDLESNVDYVSWLKMTMINQLKSRFDDIEFNGDCENGGLYNIINVSFKGSNKSALLIQKLDLEGIAVSGGSACHNNNETESYILRNIGSDMTRISLRFSLGKYNTSEDIDYCVNKLSEILQR